MKICIFVGPTLPLTDARRELDAVFLPPVSQGDVLRAVEEGAGAIGIIDGYFENQPAVWHKEILFAMSKGVEVFGSASMGALRAAELAPFGMEGVGAIFRAFEAGHLEDDDEVAVIHGPAELGYPILSEAMVNIRRTLSDALEDGVIRPDIRAALERTAKALPYKMRGYGNLLELAMEAGIAEEDLKRFKSWLPTGRVDQKREDALLMLRVMRERLAVPNSPKSVSYHFERTTIWERAIRWTFPDRETAPIG